MPAAYQKVDKTRPLTEVAPAASDRYMPPTTEDKRAALAAKAQAAEAYSKEQWDAPKPGIGDKAAGLYDQIIKSISPSTAGDKEEEMIDSARLEKKNAAKAALRERLRKEQQGGI